MPKEPIRHSKETPAQPKCAPKRGKAYKEALRMWQFINPTKKIDPSQRAALIYLGEPLNREERK